MIARFLDNIKAKKLLKAGERVLLAISGGIDSMVMLYLFEKSGFDYGVVHCNFQLRGFESDQDEEFVKKMVLSHGVPAFFKRFETEEYAEINGISIEMAARELRYEYFEKVRAENNYSFIATAHHSDDLIETFFLNLTRKTGIKGLTGIKEKSGKIIRPLLFANRSEIEKFASENFIEFREDSTNNEVFYQRNFLRHRILPLFSELNPSFKKNLLSTIENLKDAENVYSRFFENERKKVVNTVAGSQVVDIEKLLKSEHPKILLFEILSEFNFNAATIEEAFQNLGGEPGKQFYSKTHRLIKDREKLFIAKLINAENRIYYIEPDDVELFEPLNLTLEKISAREFIINKEPNVACLDFDKLEFPLLIRKWQDGDYFRPLGMNGLKKLSDFFIDQKVPVHQKENIWLLLSGGKIVWAMGMRIDDRFKITKKTRNILQIEIRP